MKNKSFFLSLLHLCGIVLLCIFTISAQIKIPAPSDVLGFTPGDDRKLASWNQVVSYFQKLDAASDRVQFQEIGKTTLGAPFVYATISSPDNLKDLEKYKQINAKLADPRTFKSDDAAANQLIKEGKTIVLITCGVHSNEVGSYLSSMLIADKLVNATDAETLKILDNTIILLVPSLNPDGVDIIKNWYDKTLGTPFEGTDPPELYHKYVGHDDNRDWYAFTQIETQLTVDKIHNLWHPQIVHDIHQQGAYSSRLFLPPYMQPVEPNVPKELVEGYTELGNYIASSMRAKGFSGITTDSTYDAWTPARAYSHYHGGVRILSETASCKLATPVKIEFSQLREGLGYDPKKESPNFSPVWKGGEWHIRDITNYMTTGALTLLKHASDNREKWLSRFYAVGKEAVSPRKNNEVWAYLIPPTKAGWALQAALQRGGVKLDIAKQFILNGKTYPSDTAIVKAGQPYFSFAKAMIEPQIYPDLRDKNNQPIPPYDVTAHTLSLLLGAKVDSAFQPFDFALLSGGSGSGQGSGGECKGTFNYWTYKSSIPVMDEGWSRWVIEKYGWMLPRKSYCQVAYGSTSNKEIREKILSKEVNAIIFPDQSPNQLLNGYAKGSMPDEYTGGIGKEGVANLRKFVEDGGTLVFLNRASRFAIQQFGLPIRDITEGLPSKEFYIPGSILKTELDTSNLIATNMPKESIAWFEDSPAFEITMSDDTNVHIIASYPKNPKDVLLSGWALGAEKIAGKAALVSINIGKGKIILFGFRPQYRGQSLATFPLFFNAVSN